MKLKVIVSVFVALLVSIPIFVFSSLGNDIIAKAIIYKLNQETNLDWAKDSLTLTPNAISANLHTKDNKLSLFLNGEYSLLSQNIDANFFITTNEKLPLKYKEKHYIVAKNEWIDGKINGKFSNYTIIANSNLLKSDSDVILNYEYTNFKDMKLSTKDASLLELLHFLNQDSYSDAILEIDANIHSNNEAFGGIINIDIEGGEVNRKIIEDQFSLTMPRTSFAGTLKAIIGNNTIEHMLSVYSTIGDISLEGNTSINSLTTDTKFNINLQNISPLSPIFNIPLNGSIKSIGTAKGDPKNMLLAGDIWLTNSEINYNLNLNNLKPKNLKATSDKLDSKDIFNLFNQLTYFDGILTLSMNIRDFNKGISGNMSLNSNKLFINSPLLEDITNIGFPASIFTFQSNIDLSNGDGIINYQLNSPIANINAKDGKLSTNQMSIDIPISVEISKLQNISYNNKSILNGYLKANGNHKNNELTIQGNIIQNDSQNPFLVSNTMQGKNLRINKLTSSQIYKIFPHYPKYLDGIGNLYINIDNTNNTQNINIDIEKASLTNNSLLKELNKNIKTNLKNQTFSGYIYNTMIGNQLQSRIQLNSQKIQLNSQKITTDLTTNKMDGELSITENKKSKKYIIQNTITNPKIIGQ